MAHKLNLVDNLYLRQEDISIRACSLVMYENTLLVRKGDTPFFYSLKEGLRMN